MCVVSLCLSLRVLISLFQGKPISVSLCISVFLVPLSVHFFLCLWVSACLSLAVPLTPSVCASRYLSPGLGLLGLGTSVPSHVETQFCSCCALVPLLPRVFQPLPHLTAHPAPRSRQTATRSSERSFIPRGHPRRQGQGSGQSAQPSNFFLRPSIPLNASMFLRQSPTSRFSWEGWFRG